MPQIYVDPEELRGFARVLKDLAQHADSKMAVLNAQLARLHGTWRDQEFERFAAQVQQTQARLTTFANEAEKTVTALQRDAEAMVNYQKS